MLPAIPDVVQNQSPGGCCSVPIPIENVPSEIRVRLFPILAAPAGEPYPITKDANVVQVSNSSALDLTVGGQSKINARKFIFDFANQNIKIFSGVADHTPFLTLPLAEASLERKDLNSVSEVLSDVGAAEVRLTFRGNFDILKTDFSPEKLWSLINVVNIDEYLYAVVPSEMPTSWNLVALEVQAVAARSYAVHQLLFARQNGQNWDVDPTTNFQSYRGASYEHPSGTSAVRNTTGKVLTYQGGVIEASFSSHSGGYTCSAKECFNLPDEIPYLQAKRDAIEMELLDTPAIGTWEACMTPELISYRLAQYAYGSSSVPAFGIPTVTTDVYSACADANFRNQVRSDYPKLDIQSVTVDHATSTGRIWNIAAQLSNGSRIQFGRDSITNSSGEILTPSLRAIMLGRKSYRFSVSAADAQGIFKILGHGYGHGVGMSQYGAQLRADKYKQDLDQILSFYYTGTQISYLKPALAGATLAASEAVDSVLH